ncbi:MAG: hypothetical protein K0R49_716, partial [Burkholderiales bacterium]|nr:hypothetical protein [Burkholderiales bacterium]
LPEQVQPQMYNLLKQYTLARGSVYANVANESATVAALYFAENLQKQMWDIAVANCNKEGALKGCSQLVIPALNDMFDVTTTREVARESHPPLTIYVLLILLSLFSAVLVGYDLPRSTKRNMLYMISYALIISLILYLVVEIEMPRDGLITINEADHIILDLADKM